MYKKIIIGAGVLGVLGVGYYGISPLFRHVRVDEAAPQAKGAESVGTNTNIPTKSPPPNEDSVSTSDNTTRELRAPITGTIGHPASGSVRVIHTENGTVVRYEDFKTLNGPDLYVYLAKNLDAKEYVNLGTLKATEGNVNYNVPTDVNVSDYRYAMVWCKQFGVLFNYADLMVIK